MISWPGDRASDIHDEFYDPKPAFEAQAMNDQVFGISGTPRWSDFDGMGKTIVSSSQAGYNPVVGKAEVTFNGNLDQVGQDGDGAMAHIGFRYQIDSGAWTTIDVDFSRGAAGAFDHMVEITENQSEVSWYAFSINNFGEHRSATRSVQVSFPEFEGDYPPSDPAAQPDDITATWISGQDFSLEFTYNYDTTFQFQYQLDSGAWTDVVSQTENSGDPDYDFTVQTNPWSLGTVSTITFRGKVSGNNNWTESNAVDVT